MKFLFNNKLSRNRNVEVLLPQTVEHVNKFCNMFQGACAYNRTLSFAWGRKHRWKYYIHKYILRRQVVFLEEGFIRSKDLDNNTPSMSIIVDPIGVYYDATRYSSIEGELNAANFSISDEERKQAQKAISLIIKNNISKYNCSPALPDNYWSDNKKKILIIDQVPKDLSVKYGLAQNVHLDDMVAHAKTYYPESMVIIKPHPVNMRSGKLSHLENIKGVDMLVKDYNTISVLKQIDVVYVMTSQVGFEALMLNKKVMCFGMPFYAGWGCTVDQQQCARRNKTRSVIDMFVVAYLRYCLYFNSQDNSPCDIFTVIDLICSEGN